MATIVELPRLSDTMEEGVVAKWLIKKGDKVKRGQVIAEIETDKATMEFESFDAGIVLKLVATEGDTLSLGAPIAVLGKEGEDPEAALASVADKAEAKGEPADSSPKSEAKADPKSHAKPAASETAAAAPSQASPRVSDPDGRIPASPLARRLAREAGLELESIEGSGPHGRVVKTDVLKAAESGTGSRSAKGGKQGPSVSGFSSQVDTFGRPYAAREDTVVPLSQMRKAIVRTMVKSKTEAPDFYLTTDVDMTAAAAMRGKLNLVLDGAKVSFNDLVISAVAKALQRHPRCNAHYTAEGIVQYGDVHVGVAVALEDGLIVPVVRHAEQKSLRAISLEVRDLGKRAKKKQLKPDEMSGSTFTVSNLGMFGIHEFSAVINPGEAGILAVGMLEERPAVHEGELRIRKKMKMTMSCDHRVIDGAVGAQFLASVTDYLEHPMKLFA